MLKYLGYIFVLIIYCFSIKGFGQIIESSDEGNLNEFTIGINTNTNSGLIGGFNFRYTYKKEDKKSYLYYFEVVNVRHEKEERFSAISTSFIPNKINYLLSLRPSYGREINLFNKYPEDGLRLNFAYSAGPSIGLQKPYFINYFFPGEGFPRTEAFDPDVHVDPGRVDGDAGILRGLGESTVKLGAHSRAALNFEYGPYPELIIGLEAGVTIEGFATPVVIFDIEEERRLFSAFFIHLYYGFSF